MKQDTSRVPLSRITGLLLALLLAFSAAPVHAEEATSTDPIATTTQETATTTPLIIEGSVDVPSTCEVTDTDGVAHEYPAASSTDTYLAICALAAAKEDGILSDIGLSNEFPDFGLFLTSVNDVAADSSSQFWALYKNGDSASLGLTSLPVGEGDTIDLKLQDFSGTDLGDRLTLHVDALLGTKTEESGDTATTTPLEETVTLSLRDGDTLVGPFTLELPATTTPAVALTPTGGSTAHEVPARSVLALLSALDATTTDFAITDLAYFDSFGSFIVNCIEIPSATGTPECFDWTYAVDSAFPQVGMDSYELEAGDTVYIIFGSQWKLTASASSVSTNEPFTVTAQVYDPSSGLYAPADGITVGAVQFDANFTATEFATSTTDGSGQATLSLPLAGTYSIGLAQTGYFPNVGIAVSSSTATSPPQTGGGGSGGTSHESVDVPAALAFLADNQEEDGSFGSLFLTDWAALALVAGRADTDALRDYFKTEMFNLESVTDYERHTMALLALRLNPYEAAGEDYVTPIVEAFDGTQIGDADLDNDDIFALFPLLHVGYGTDDPLIEKTIAFIVSRQRADGSWDESVDVTAAAVQALSLADSLPGVQSALQKAEAYLRGTQSTDGGFENSFATSWVLQAIAALGDSPESWAAGAATPEEYLADLQEEDGGIEPASSSRDTRIWATSYAVPGALGKTWDDLLDSFPKPKEATLSGGGGTSQNAVEDATSTPSIAESIATSTISGALLPDTAPAPQVLGAFTERSGVAAASVPHPEEAAPDVSLATASQAFSANAEASGLLSRAWSAFASFFSFLWGLISNVVH